MTEEIIRNPEALNDDALAPNDGYSHYLARVAEINSQLSKEFWFNALTREEWELYNGEKPSDSPDGN